MLMENSILHAKKLGLPEIILPNDVRNDLYVNVYSAELSRLSKTADRNVEVKILEHRLYQLPQQTGGS